MNNKLHLVGSIPYDSVEDVFEQFGVPLGDHLHTLPDGEVGLRSHWISRIHYQVLALHPDIEVVRQPELDGGAERLNPRNAGDSWLFRVRAGAGTIQFGDPGWRLGFARDAVNSYFIFKTMRDAGRLAAHLRFQVSMPTVTSALPGRIFEDPLDAEKIKPGYEAALAREIKTITAYIPAEDLAIQWDCTSELQDAYGQFPDVPADDLIERNMVSLGRLCTLVPEAAELGYHLYEGAEGKGYATEAGRAVLDFARDRLGMTDLASMIDPANTASQSVARRLGAQNTGTEFRADPEGKPVEIWRHDLTGERP